MGLSAHQLYQPNSVFKCPIPPLQSLSLTPLQPRRGSLSNPWLYGTGTPQYMKIQPWTISPPSRLGHGGFSIGKQHMKGWMNCETERLQIGVDIFGSAPEVSPQKVKYHMVYHLLFSWNPSHKVRSNPCDCFNYCSSKQVRNVDCSLVVQCNAMWPRSPSQSLAQLSLISRRFSFCVHLAVFSLIHILHLSQRETTVNPFVNSICRTHKVK